MPVDHYENFPVASLLLPRALRHPVEVIYRFARSADDLADEGEALPAERLAALDGYRQALKQTASGLPLATEAPPWFADLAAVIRQWQLPMSLFHDLLDAFSQDVVQTRYDDHATLRDYCRRSANPVGRLLLHLCRCDTPLALQQSDAICTALQLINFWQDVAIDWGKGRIYLPATELKAYGLGEATLAACGQGQPPPAAWSALMASQTRQARELMQSGAPLVHTLPGRMGWEIRLTVQGGLRILEKIDRVAGNVFAHRPTLQRTDWLLLAGRSLTM